MVHRERRRARGGDGVKIGYSFWGFLGSGIRDTPDGGRSHRRTLIDATIAAGHDILFLQADRDRDEAATTLPYHWEPTGFPEIDVLMLDNPSQGTMIVAPHTGDVVKLQN